jgi:prepilin-type N-terminal cleavage/methylation domain-containing protein
MRITGNKNGFTLLEVLIVLGISLLLLGGAGMMLKSNSNALRAEQTAETAASLMKNVQSKARQQEGDARWGVQIDNTTGNPVTYSAFMVDEDLLGDPLFTGIPGVVTDTFAFPSQITSTSPPAGTSVRIIFEKGTGLPTSPTSVVIQVGNDTSSAQTISIDANGRIGE